MLIIVVITTYCKKVEELKTRGGEQVAENERLRQEVKIIIVIVVVIEVVIEE